MKNLFCLLALFIVTQNAWSWGTQGHMIVAQIGEDNLSPKAKATVGQILRNRPMAEVANWADAVKSGPQWSYTKPWHFVDIPDGQDYTSVEHSHDGDVVTAITQMVSVLKDKSASAVDKENALMFIIHFVGDIHQPLHVGRPSDHGGNLVNVVFEGRNTNLHSLWDTSMIMKSPMDYIHYAHSLEQNSFLAPYDIPEVTFSTIISENMDARKSIYSFKAVDSRPVVLDAAYYDKNIELMNSRLLAGGKRLATLLNQIYQ